MSRFNTGNPLDSDALQDLSDNAKNADLFSNDMENESYADRFGRKRKTIYGMELEFDRDQDDRKYKFDVDQGERSDRFNEFLLSSGYQFAGDYAAGIEITAHNQYVTFGGQPYLLKPSIPVPYTTSGEWTGDDFKLIGDDTLRQDLANPDKGAAMVRYMGRTQAQRNKDQPSVYDYDGATFQQRLEAAINSGGPLTVPPGRYVLEPFAVSPSEALYLSAHGAVFVPSGRGKLFDFGSHSAHIEGAVFDMEGLSTMPPISGLSSYALFFDSATDVKIQDVSFLKGAYGLWVANGGHVTVDECYGEGASSWHIFIQGCESAIITRNRVFNGAYDGIKLGGANTHSPEVVTTDVIIQGNITGGNARDGIDFALNVGGGLLVANNISRNDLLKGIDAKVVYQSSVGLEDPTFMGNISIKKGIPLDVGLNVQSDIANGRITRPQIIGNKAFADSGVLGGPSSASLRLSGTDSAYVFGNVGVGSYHGIRLTGAAVDTHIEQNSYSKCVHGVQSQASSEGTPSNNVITRNRFNCTGHAYPVDGSVIRLDAANATQIYENDWEVSNSAYAVQAENVNTAATGTIIGKNYRGFSQTLPTGHRAVVGETWRNNSTELGSPAEWVCMTQTSSTGVSSVYGVGQRGYRSVAGNPVGVLIPQFRSERVFDTTNRQWWTAYGNLNDNWA